MDDHYRHCPGCDGELELEGDFWVCNNEDCTEINSSWRAFPKEIAERDAMYSAVEVAEEEEDEGCDGEHEGNAYSF